MKKPTKDESVRKFNLLVSGAAIVVASLSLIQDPLIAYIFGGLGAFYVIITSW